jgi:hypothetical protein
MKPVARCFSCLVTFIAALSLSCDTQEASGPRPTLSFDRSTTGADNKCLEGKDRDSRTAPVAILCAVTVPGNPLVSVAKGWIDPETEAYYVDDQSNKALDIIDAERYTYVGRVAGFAGAATGASGGAITYGGGTATSNGQGPNSIVPARHGQIWVSDGNSMVHVVSVGRRAAPNIAASISTAIAACDGGTATTHYCGRTNEMTYDPEHRIILVENPNPLDLKYCTTAGHNCATNAAVSAPGAGTLPPYASFISAVPPYTILGTVSFPDAKGTTEAPVWDRELGRFLVPVPTCSGTTGPTACNAATGATQYIAVVDPKTRSVEKKYMLPDCATLMPGITPAGTGMLNDLSIDERDQHVIMPVCGKGEVVFDARTGAVVNVVTEIAGSDETWFNPADGRFYVVAATPGGANVGNANTTSLGVIDGRSGLWLQNVLDVGGKIPAASAETNRAFTTVTVPVGVVASKDSTACAQFGFTGTGCITVFEHEGKAGHDKDHGGENEHGR